MQPNINDIDYAIIEVSAVQMKGLSNFHPKMVILPILGKITPEGHFKSAGEFIETKLSIIKSLSPDDMLVINFDALGNNSFLEMRRAKSTGIQGGLLRSSEL